MSRDEDFDRWFRRRRQRWPSSFFGFDFGEMDRMIEQMFKDMAETMPKELYREEKLPDGTTIRKMGPLIYGYSMTIGPDGKPVIREFGNVRPSQRAPFGAPRPPIELKEEREPLVDIISDNGTIRVVVELPGVEKEDIKLRCSEKILTITVDTPERKYRKEVELPAEVDPKIGKASYKNGVLEITLNKVEKRRPSGEPIEIE